MKEQKLILVEAEVDYSDCYYEGDIPQASCNVKEVTIAEAIKAFSEECGISYCDILDALLPPKSYRGKTHHGRFRHVEEELAKRGYYHSSRIKSWKAKGDKK